MPDFVKIEIDPIERKAMLSVEDTTIKQQREMWGELMTKRLFFFFPGLPGADFLVPLLVSI